MTVRTFRIAQEACGVFLLHGTDMAEVLVNLAFVTVAQGARMDSLSGHQIPSKSGNLVCPVHSPHLPSLPALRGRGSPVSSGHVGVHVLTRVPCSTCCLPRIRHGVWSLALSLLSAGLSWSVLLLRACPSEGSCWRWNRYCPLL